MAGECLGGHYHKRGHRLQACSALNRERQCLNTGSSGDSGPFEHFVLLEVFLARLALGWEVQAHEGMLMGEHACSAAEKTDLTVARASGNGKLWLGWRARPACSTASVQCLNSDSLLAHLSAADVIPSILCTSHVCRCSSLTHAPVPVPCTCIGLLLWAGHDQAGCSGLSEC